MEYCGLTLDLSQLVQGGDGKTPFVSRTPGNGRGGLRTIRTDFEEILKTARSQSGQN